MKDQAEDQDDGGLYRARLAFNDDGSLNRPRFEQYALLQADGVDAIKAWRLLAPKTTDAKSTGSNYRKTIDKSRIFKMRLDILLKTKDELMALGIWGQIEWQARQMYATARATNDTRLMEKATDTLLKVADRIDPAPKRTGPGETRGAPAAETPPNDPSDNVARRQLLEKHTAVDYEA